MPFTAVVIVAAMGVSLLRGGRLSRAADADLRRSWLLFAGLGLQLVLDFAAMRGHLSGGPGYLLLLTSHLMVLGWVATNWHLRGMGLVFLGFLANAVVIAANGAMPVSAEAIRALGLEGVAVHPGKHVAMTADTSFAWLGDRYPLPPIDTIISIGDMVLAAGLLPLVHQLLTFRPAAERRGGPRANAAAYLTDTPPTPETRPAAPTPGLAVGVAVHRHDGRSTEPLRLPDVAPTTRT